jgi:hypothetical protein
MKAVYDSCETAGLNIPNEVCCFFNHKKPDPNGIVVDIGHKDGGDGDPGTWDISGVELVSEDMTVGVVLPIDQLPDNITHLRITLHW